MSDIQKSDALSFDSIDYDTMTPAQFEQYLPELFAVGGPLVTADPRFHSFLDRNPDCAALVRDLEAIAQAAREILSVGDEEPSDSIWSKIQKEMGSLATQPLSEAE